MADKGQDLFDIMDAALKRQREGMDATLKRQDGQGTGAAAAPPTPAAPPVQPAAAPPPPAPVPPQAPVQPPPVQQAPPPPVQAQSPAGAGSDRTVAPSDRMAPPSSRDSAVYTDRLSRVPDSARSAPVAGTLSPGEVLRGTVFASSRTTASGRTEAVPSSEVVAPAEPPPVQGPPRPATVQTTASNVLRPRGPSAPPPISTPISKIGTVRAATPSGVQPAVGSSQRTTTPSGRGIFVSVEMAVLAVIAMAMSLICAFFLGARVGKSENDLTGGKDPGNGKVESQPGDGIRETDPSKIKPIQIGKRPVTPKGDPTPIAVPSGTGKWTVEVMRYTSESSAKRMAKWLKEKGLSGVFIGKRTVRRRKELCVCVGRFPSRSDPRAKLLKDKVINIDRRRFTTLVEIVKLD